MGTFWAEELLEAYDTGKFSESAKKNASAWPTCAIGELAPNTAQALDAGEVNVTDLQVELYRLGTDFSRMVGEDDYIEANKVYQEISRTCREYRKRSHRMP